MPIRVELELADGSFTSRMIHAGESVAQFRNNVGQAVTGVQRLNDHATTFIGTLRDISITLGMARIAFDGLREVGNGWIGDVVKINAEMERLKFLLAGMSKASDPMKDAANQVKYLRDFAKDAPFSLAALSDTFVKLRSAGIDPMNGALKGLTDGIAAFGGNDEVLKRATVSLQQMAGKGVIQMEELRQQLGEAMPRAVELMARSMGLSVGQLIQEVSKGTLDAKSSLEQFTLELDRTFGGAAAEQMNTFNGMISKSKTLFQSLALTAGEHGFFDAIKTQVRDLNEALAGDKFTSMAGTIGNVMASVVNGLAGGIRTVIQFKDQILATGEALVVVFGVSTLAKGLVAFGGMIEGMRAGLAKLRIDAALTASSLSGTGGLIGGVRSMTDAWAALKLSTEAFGTAMTRLLPLLGAGIAFIAEWALPVALLGAALYGLWQAFGAGKDTVKEAHESMAKFGAETQKQIDQSDAYVQSLDARIKKLQELKALYEADAARGEGASTGNVDSELEKTTAERDKAKGENSDAKVVFAKKQAEKYLQIQQDQLDERLARIKANNDAAEIAASQAHKDELKKLQDAHKDISAENERYKREELERNLDMYRQQKEAAGGAMVEVQMAVDSGNQAAIDAQEKFKQKMLAYVADRQKSSDSQSAMGKSAREVDKPQNIAKLLDQAATKLDSVKGEMAAQKAQLQGVNGEYARMIFLIEESVAKSNGVYKIDNPEIQKIINQLKVAQVESDKLQAQIKALTSFDGDLASAEATATQAYIKELTNGKDGLDAVAAKKIAGLYDGKSPIERMMSGVKGSAEEAGKAMNDAFGADNQTKGSTLTSIVERLGTAWGRVRDHAAGVANESMSMDPVTYKPGSTYSQNVARHESGNRPDAKNDDSSAVGLGQFIKKTWEEFLKSEHPELVGNGKDMRSDPKLGEEAIAWYGAHNANKLQKGGVEPNDANLYLAHFLGPDGALSALTKSSDTLLSSIKTLDPARAANPGVFNQNKTVGDLQGWAKGFMGPGMSASRSGQSDFAVNTLLPGANQGERDSIMRTRSLQDETARLKGENNLAGDMKNAALEIAKAANEEDGLNKHLAATQKLISEGRFGLDKDPMSDRYKALIKLVEDWDKADATAAERKKLREKADGILSKMPGEADSRADKEDEANRRNQDGTKFKFSPGLRTQERVTNREIEALQQASDANPKNKARNDAAIAVKQSDMERDRNTEIQNAVTTENEKVRAVKQSLMTAGEAREAAFQEDVKRNENFLKLYTGDAEKRKQLEAQVTENIKAYRAQQFDASPIGGMLKTWRDFGQNMQQASVGWMNGFNDKLADMAMKGRVSFRSLALSIEKDIITMSLKAGESQLFSSLLGGAGMFGSGAAMGSMTVGGQMFPAFHHTGGFAGANMPSRGVNPMLFAGAQRWHGGTGGMTLAGDEIPIIAKRGEQVDWPSNLAKQYGGKGGGGTFSMGDIHVGGASNGSPSQNKDLAEQIQGHIKQAAQEMVGAELRTQSRPGGTLHGRK